MDPHPRWRPGHCRRCRRSDLAEGADRRLAGQSRSEVATGQCPACTAATGISRLTSSMNWICEPGTPVKSANMLPVTLVACHPERSEGSHSMGAEMLRGVYTERSACAQHDTVRLLEGVFFTWQFN